MGTLLACLAALPALVLLIFIFISWATRPFMKSLSNKHVFITGASSGIGLAIAERALLQGAMVTLVSRNPINLTKAVEKLVKEAECSPEKIRCEVADVGDYDSISAAIKNSRRWKPIDVLVCNAGLTRGGYLDTASVQDLELTVRTNLMGTINSLHSALPDMKQRSLDHPTSIVIMASLASLFIMYGHSVYTATKYAMRGLAEGLRFELLPYNIKVSLICPYFTDTPFLDDADKERDICQLMKRVNLYHRRYAESADSVARQTVEAIKKGTFLVTTHPIGFFLGIVGRGFVPSESFVRALAETILFFPMRLVATILTCDFRLAIIRQRKKVDGVDVIPGRQNP